MYRKERPIIISIVSILQMLAGALILLLGGLFIILTFGLLGEEISSTWESAFAGAFGAVFIILAGVFFFIGFLIFILGYGLWKMNLAAWFVSVFLYGLSSISIVFSFETLYMPEIQAGNFSNLLTPIITIGLFVYFLTVKDRFN